MTVWTVATTPPPIPVTIVETVCTVCVDPMIVVFPVMDPATMLPLSVPGSTGNETGFGVGVRVREPKTIFGIETEVTGVAVPLRVAVMVLEDTTSVRVTTPAGRAVKVGFVVWACDLVSLDMNNSEQARLTGAKLLVVMAASDTPENVVVTCAVTFATGIRAVATAFSPPFEHFEKLM